jgi:hypothetical protein
MRIKIAVLASFVLLAVSLPALAKKNPPRLFLLSEVVTLNGAQVPAGVYELVLDTQGSTVRVTLQKDGNFVATARGVLVKNGSKYSEDAALLRVNSDGTRSLIEIRIAGASKAIVLDQSDASVRYTALKR